MKNHIAERLAQGIKDKVFPGAVVGVVQDGVQTIVPVGNFTYEDSPQVNADTQYDVASITKSIPTASIALMLIEKGSLHLDARLVEYIPEYNNSYKNEITIKQLLTYSLKLDLPVPGFSYETATPQAMWKVFLTREPRYPPGSKFEYSNPPSILLGKAIENVTGSTLDKLADEHFFGPLRMTNTTFSPQDRQSIPPTEITEWRGEIQGVVHDETSYILSKEKAVGCAGIFSTAGDILTFLTMLLNKGEMDGHRYFSEETVASMHTNQLASIGTSMGLGWELNEPRYMGKYVTPNMFGKTGFTGTVCMADPERKIGLVILSNRTYPKRSSSEGIDAVRRDIADIVFAP